MEYIPFLKQAFEEWSTSGKCSYAEDLNNKIGKPYFDTANPHAFAGDFNSQLVLVHLNPKRNHDDFGKKSTFLNFDDYLEKYKYFGKNAYGKNSPRKHKSKFDHKQIRFLEPLNVLPFREGDTYHNLEVVCDNKLQIELIPFGSPNFNYNVVGIENIKPYMQRILNLIFSNDREYVIFCGKVFYNLLKPYSAGNKSYSFKLNKNDGGLTKNDFELTNIQLQYENKSMNAIIAPQFAKQGYPVGQYGQKVKSYYGLF